MNAQCMVRAVNCVDGTQLRKSPVVGLAEECADLAFPLAYFRAKHLDARSLPDGLAIVDVDIIPAPDGFHNSKMGSMNFEVLRVEFVEAGHRTVQGQRAIARKKLRNLRRTCPRLDTL